MSTTRTPTPNPKVKANEVDILSEGIASLNTTDGAENGKDNEVVDGVEKIVPPFMRFSRDVHLRIFGFLDVIDMVCLSVVNKPLHALTPSLPRYPFNRANLPLCTGAPYSSYPVEKRTTCRHCLPALYYPTHCELHYHLRSFIPEHLTYCGSFCGRFTMAEGTKGMKRSLSWTKRVRDGRDREEMGITERVCGSCGVRYWKRYERGRRMLDVERPGEEQERLRMWYSQPMGS